MNEDVKRSEFSLESLKDRIPSRERVLYVTDHFMDKASSHSDIEECDPTLIPEQVLDLIFGKFNWESDEEYNQISSWIKEWSSDNSITVSNDGDVCTVVG